MTRETKIGLLVGLAFTILIGILLSEHLSSINEPQAAPLNSTGANVRDGIVTPGVSDDGPPISIAGAPVESPRQPVPTNVDLHPPVTYIPSRTGRTRGQSPNNSRAATPLAGVDPNPDSPDGGATAPPTLSRNARDLIRQHPDALIPYDLSNAMPPARPAAAAGTAYVAVAGDSVSRIASRLMGGNTKANRELLIRANPSMQAEGNVVVIGRTYVIPKSGSTGSTDSTSSRQAGSTGSPQAGSGPASAPHGNGSDARPSESTRWYTVKGDDNLWKIAEAQLGSGNAWTQIRDLNKDLLGGGETVHANMRLRLPAKTSVAGAD